MGSWYDNLKSLPRPDWITIKPYGSKIKVILQYNNPKIRTKEIIIDEEVSFCLKGLNAQVEKGERWGDWGGPIKCGDIIYVSKKEKQRARDLKPVRVEFT